MDTYIRKVLKVSVAQICLTIGYNSIQSIPLELLVDSLHKFLQEFARDLHRHVELFNRTEANLDDVALTLQSLNIGVGDLLEYINQVEPVACNIEIPQLPAQKQSNLNFLKPGSKEVLTRPVHIYEHLPPILRNSCEPCDQSQVSNLEASPTPNANNFTNHTAICNESTEESAAKTNGTHVHDASEGDPNSVVPDSLAGSPLVEVKKKPTLDVTPAPSPAAVPSSATREISSVMMTSGGFISPAIEGRMPECNIPDIVDKYFGLDAPVAPAPTSTGLSQASAQSGKPPAGPPSQSTLTSSSQRGLLKAEDSGALSSGNKFYQPVDKKLLKKVKKRSMMSMGSPNVGGVAPAMPNDKAQRKRIKMLQKSMAKTNAGGTGATFKTKNGNGFGGNGPQEKFRKKQYKLRQKQFAQKQLENALSATAGVPAPAPAGLATSSGTGKLKKDSFIAPPQISEKPSADIASDSFVTPVNLHSFKETAYNEPAVGSQDVVVNPSAVPLPHPILHGPPSPQYEDVKLNNEPDRSKLNIFKKISSSRKERADTFASTGSALTAQPTPSNTIQSSEDVSTVSTPSNTTIFSNDQVISLPSGTTITPAPPSGSGRHVYAPPPSSQMGDFNSVVQVDDSGAIPECSAVLMKRGDLMIHKPKKRGRKPGSKNQPKILGFPTKKTKKLKKTLFGPHPGGNLLEPLNLSHGSIANIANIPLGIASTFPLDPESAIKLKKDRKKAKLGKDPNFNRATGKSGNSRNLAPTKEEFASINQKLMTIDTVLLAAPPYHSSSPTMPRPNSPGLEVSIPFPADSDSVGKVKKERKKSKQSKVQKLFNQQCNQSLSSPMPGNHKTSPNMGTSRKSPQPYAPNFANVPGMGGLPMFSFFPYTARPGLIPSHNLFSQMPNMQNNGLFMPPLMGFRPLNPPIRSFLKEEREATPPLLQASEGNYSKVAPLVPDTMKLDFSPPSHGATSTPGMSGLKGKNSSMSSNASSKAGSATPTGPQFTPESITATSSQTSTMNLFGDMRKKVEEHNSSTIVSSSSGNTISSLRNIDVTIEVSSDDSLEDGISPSKPKLPNRTTITSTTTSSTFIQRLPHPISEFSASENVSIVNDSETSPTERRNKDHKKLKKLGKQGRKSASISGPMEAKNPGRADPGGDVGDGFDDGLSSMLVNAVPESAKKSDDMGGGGSFGHAAYDYQVSPERRKDHKKMKKLLKEGKLKKKKDKKDKNKSKDRSEKLIKGDKSEKRKEDRKDKDKLKKLKKEKKKEKQRSDMDVATVKCTSSGEGTGSSTEVSSVVPKLTLKLGQSSQSPTQVDSGEGRKMGQKSGLPLANSGAGGKASGSVIGTSTGREPSPELARISPLVTRPPKQKSGADELISSSCVISPVGNMSSTGQILSGSHQAPSLSASLNMMDSVIDVDSNSGGPTTSTLPASATILGLGINASNNPSPGSSAMPATGTASNSMNVSMHAGATQHSQHQTSHQSMSATKQSTAVPLLSETNRPSSYIDAEGNRVWICPACGKVDDGSAMIGCDGCDAWYHWVCVGILVAPNDNEDWYCRVCITKKRGAHSGDRKRKRNKNKKS